MRLAESTSAWAAALPVRFRTPVVLVRPAAPSGERSSGAGRAVGLDPAADLSRIAAGRRLRLRSKGKSGLRWAGLSRPAGTPRSTGTRNPCGTDPLAIRVPTDAGEG